MVPMKNWVVKKTKKNESFPQVRVWLPNLKGIASGDFDHFVESLLATRKRVKAQQLPMT